MIRAFDGEKTVWFSGENDWTNKDGHTIAVWEGTIIREDEYPDFISWIKEESGADAEPVGSFQLKGGLTVFVFLVKTNIPKFSIWRFRLPGMRWWYDMFWETNGGREVDDKELIPILDKLGLVYPKELLS